MKLNIDPTFRSYLADAIASRPVPLHLVDVVERRAATQAARSMTAPALPAGISVEWIEIASPAGTISARVTRPERTGMQPAIVYCHGGGWMYGSPDQSAELAQLYAHEVGAVVVNPQYRLSPEHRFPAAFDDCFAVLRFVMENAGRIGIDPSRIAVAGESSGGNLAAAIAIAARDVGLPALRLQVLNYPALDTDFDTDSYRQNADAPILSRDEMIYFWNNYLGGNLDIADPRARPLSARSFSGLPPAHIMVAEYDPLREDGIRFARKLESAGVPVDLVYVKGLTHGFFRALRSSTTVARHANAVCTALREHLIGPATPANTQTCLSEI